MRVVVRGTTATADLRTVPAPMNPNDEIVVKSEPVGSLRRRERYQPLEDGRYRLVEEYWTGCRWHERDRELVEEVSVEMSD